METKTLSIRPYARLLTMLGDQLIKNEIVALTELVKNAYDADSDFCSIAFSNVSNDYETNSSSYITISDNGYGMSYEVITNHFLNPATPIKKKEKDLRKSRKGRVCQGEKGIGRFSMLKLGKKVSIYSKEDENSTIHKVVFDFESFDDEFLARGMIDEDIYLDQLEIQYYAIKQEELPKDSTIQKYGHGTVIVIESLKGEWNSDKVKRLKEDLIKFSPLEISDSLVVKNKDFEITILKNNREDLFFNDAIDKLKNLVIDKALYKLSGKYDEKKRTILFEYSQAGSQKQKVLVQLINHETPNEFEKKLWGLSYYKKELKNLFENNETTICGSFGFEFYIFDFAANQADPYGLTPEQKDTVRNHRVFLYRDGVRVQPYGAPNDDWLEIDRKRATVRANEMFSNDQLIGQIRITKKNNSNLKDKTSREGIIEDSQAFEQLTAIIRTFLSLIRTKLYQTYCANKEKKKRIEEENRGKKIEERFRSLEEIVENDEKAKKAVEELKNSITTQKAVYEKRLDTAENLAGVGLSVEAASHDIMLTMDRLKEKLREIKLEIGSPLTLEARRDVISAEIESAEEMFALIYMKLKDIQQLFVSSKQRPRIIRVEPIVKKIQAIYARQYSKHNIIVEYRHIGKSPVTAKLIDAVLYQVFINLFDNALYWLQLIDDNRKVVITFDGDAQSVIFSDNGYGVLESDQEYIFEAFYSGKGEDGRGMGLYIAKKLLSKNKYTIDLITDKAEKVECGANFRVCFISTDQEE